jgi:nucleotide-binding universal stress UspA family protein
MQVTHGQLEARESLTVVVGTTLRPEDAPIVEMAGFLASRLEAPLRLVHVCEDPSASLVLGTDEEYLLGAVRDELGRQAEDLRRRSGATVRPHLAAGSIVNALVSLAEFELATVLVVGPTTRRLRSTAERVARGSRVPVLVPRAPERLTAWLRDGEPLRILVGGDLGRAAEAARRFAMALGKLGPIEVEVAFVASPEETHARLGLAPPEGGLSAEAKSALLRELSRAAPPDEVAAALQVITGHGRPDAHLVVHADENEFDVIVVGQRRHSLVEQIWHGSIARGVLQSAAVTVASVPVPVGEADRSFRPPRTIVIGADLTEADIRAISHAVGHAAKGATVHVAHVLGPYESSSDLRQAREDAERHLAMLEQSVAVERWIATQTHVLEGVPSEQLLALSERVGADLLVLGARKHSAIGRAVMGSLPRSIIADSRFPVLVVPARSP